MSANPLFRHAAAWMAGLAATCAATAFAQDWYGALHIGKGWKSPAHVDHAVTNVPMPAWSPWREFDSSYNAEMDYDSGWGLGAALGRAFGNWRLEGELGYRTSKIDDFHVQEMTIDFRPDVVVDGFSTQEWEVATAEYQMGLLNDENLTRYTGRARVLIGALNLYYDLPVQWAVRPYVGAGVGVARANKKKRARTTVPLANAPDPTGCLADSPAGQCSTEVSLRGTDWDAKWQTMAGLKYAVNERWEAALGWRYTDLKGVRFELAEGADDGDFTVRKNGIHSAELTLIRRF